MLEKIKKFFKKDIPKEKSTIEEIEELFDETFTSDIIRFEIGSDIFDFASNICSEIAIFRNKTAENYGFILPPIRISQKDYLQENEIKIYIREKQILNNFLIPNLGNVTEETKKYLDLIYNDYLDEIFSNEFFEKILNKAQQDNAWLIWNISNIYTITDMKKVFLNILKQKKSIKNSTYIFEKIGEFYPRVSVEAVSKIITEII